MTPTTDTDDRKRFTRDTIEAVLYDAWQEALVGNTAEAEALCTVAQTAADVYGRPVGVLKTLGGDAP